jgi:uncharacterized membrane protein
MTEKIVLVLVTTCLPLSELRGGLPLGLALGLDPVFTLIITVVANSLLFFPVLLILDLFYERLFSRSTLFNSYLGYLRRRGKTWVDRHGVMGLTIFVAIPLPLTGAYTGTILAWLLDMDRKRAFLSIGLGVALAGVIVLLTALGIVNVLKSFI